MKRSILIVAAALVALAMVTLAYPEGFAALAIVSLLSMAAILLFRQFSDEKEFLTNVFLAALLLRLLFGIFVHVYDLRDFFGGDANTYDFRGFALTQYWLGHLMASDSSVLTASSPSGPGWGMNYLVAGLYTVFGQNIFAAQSFCAVIGAATAPMVFFCSKRLFENTGVAKISALCVAVFPAFIIWSGQLLKDGLIVFLLVLIMTMVLQLQSRFSYLSIVVLVVSLFSVMSLRFYIFYMVAIAVTGSFLIGVTNSVDAIVRRTIVLVVIGVGLTYFGVARNANVDLTRFGNLDVLQTSRMDLARSAESGYGEDTDVSTSSGALSALPIGFLYLMFAPFPWQINSFRAAITLPEVLLWWAMIPVVIYGLWFSVRHRLRKAFPVLIFSLLLTIAYSIFLGNVGTAYRQRTQIQVFLFIFLGVGVTIYQERKEDRKSRAKRRPELKI
ncbi:MAG: glycosyltransferase family 39 protein [Acidobacteriota bacterium]